MGKSKKRSIALGKHNRLDNLTRENAIEFVLSNIDKKQEIADVISLFGFNAEELLEAGADYEAIISLGSLLND